MAVAAKTPALVNSGSEGAMLRRKPAKSGAEMPVLRGRASAGGPAPGNAADSQPTDSRRGPACCSSNLYAKDFWRHAIYAIQCRSGPFVSAHASAHSHNTAYIAVAATLITVELAITAYWLDTPTKANVAIAVQSVKMARDLRRPSRLSML